VQQKPAASGVVHAARARVATRALAHLFKEHDRINALCRLLQFGSMRANAQGRSGQSGMPRRYLLWAQPVRSRITSFGHGSASMSSQQAWARKQLILELSLSSSRRSLGIKAPTAFIKKRWCRQRRSTMYDAPHGRP